MQHPPPTCDARRLQSLVSRACTSAYLRLKTNLHLILQALRVTSHTLRNDGCSPLLWVRKMAELRGDTLDLGLHTNNCPVE